MNHTSTAQPQLSKILQQALTEIGFTKLTPIQEQAIPILLAGKDVIGQSQTGSGKTAAFGLPIIDRIKLNFRSPQALILCPTRELCTQVMKDLRKFARHHTGLTVLGISGGQPSRPQLEALKKGAHILVGTPGRVTDFLGRRRLDLTDIKTIVLDEADRMLDMGFKESIDLIFDALPSTRQTVFFSATFPELIENLSQKYQNKPTKIIISTPKVANLEIKEYLYMAEASEKARLLESVLKSFTGKSCIVFCNLKATVAELKKTLLAQKINADAIHGDLEQWERELVLTKFRGQSTRVLVATDVAARGLDIDHLDLVINFDLSSDPEVYTHRIGRTGRAGKNGVAISFATARESFKLQKIQEAINRKIPIGPKIEKGDVKKADPDESTMDQQPAMVTLRISAGRKQKLRPGDILGALTGDAGQVLAKDVGKIEIQDFTSYVAVNRLLAKTICDRLKSGKIKGRNLNVTIVQ